MPQHANSISAADIAAIMVDLDLYTTPNTSRAQSIDDLVRLSEQDLLESSIIDSLELLDLRFAISKQYKVNISSNLPNGDVFSPSSIQSLVDETNRQLTTSPVLVKA